MSKFRTYIFLVIGIALFYSHSQAQTQNIIDSGDVWQDARYLVNFATGETQRIDDYIFVGGDTIINNFSYKSIYIYYDIVDYENPNLEDYGLAFIRQDTIERKLFFLPSILSQERLWYDFNATVGDTVNPDAEKTYGAGSSVVVDKDTIIKPYNDSIRYLSLEWWYNACGEQVAMLDGIGTTEGFSTPIAHLERPGGCLVCYAKKGRMVYSGSLDYQFCDKITSVRESLSQKETSFKFYPNPVSGKQGLLTIKGEFQKQHQLVLFDAVGNILYQTLVEGVNPKISFPKLQSGLYFLRVENSIPSPVIVH
jgi:hypothetical protein